MTTLSRKSIKPHGPPPVESVKPTIYLKGDIVDLSVLCSAQKWPLTCIVWDLDNLVDEGDKIRRVDSVYRRNEVGRHQAVLVGR